MLIDNNKNCGSTLSLKSSHMTALSNTPSSNICYLAHILIYARFTILQKRVDIKLESNQIRLHVEKHRHVQLLPCALHPHSTTSYCCNRARRYYVWFTSDVESTRRDKRKSTFCVRSSTNIIHNSGIQKTIYIHVYARVRICTLYIVQSVWLGEGHTVTTSFQGNVLWRM